MDDLDRLWIIAHAYVYRRRIILMQVGSATVDSVVTHRYIVSRRAIVAALRDASEHMEAETGEGGSLGDEEDQAAAEGEREEELLLQHMDVDRPSSSWTAGAGAAGDVGVGGDVQMAARIMALIQPLVGDRFLAAPNGEGNARSTR